MATVRAGNKGVLVVVDVQVGVMSEAWDGARIVNNVSRAVERARAQSVPVIWVQHSDNDLPYGSPQWQWVPELAPAKGEPLIHKSFNSSFEQTALELRHQYSIGYKPRDFKPDGSWHHLKVKVIPPRGLPRLFVRSKEGYYALTNVR